jgi:uncharacterized protein DUF3592
MLLPINQTLWQTGCAMFLELWERLRGYDKWVETQATIERSDVTATPYSGRSGRVIGYNYDAGDVITWQVPNGERQYASFDVKEGNPLFQLLSGESVTIRYDPAHPDRFYYRDLLRSRVNSAGKSVLIVLVLAGLIAVFISALGH